MKRFQLKNKTKDFLKSNTEKPETAGPSAEMSQLNGQTVPTPLKKKGCRSVRKVVSALFSKLCPYIARKVHGDNTNDINVIPPAVTRDDVISSVNKIDTAGGKEIVPTSEKKTEATSSTKHVHTSEKKTEATSSTKHVHTSEKKTEATSGTDRTTSCPCLPRRKYRLGKKKCVPPLTTQKEPAEDRPHTSREFVPQGSTPEGKHRLFFGCGKAFLCPPFCCRTKVDTEYEHKNDEKDDVPTLISQAETTSSSPFEKTAPIDRRIEVTATTDIDFDQRSEIVVEPKDGIEISIPMETVSIPESGIEIIAIMDHELDQKSTIPSTKTKDIVETVPTLEDRTASTTDRTASTTDSTASTTDRTASTTDSTASTTDRTASTTDRTASTTDSTASTTDRTASTTDRTASTTDRTASTTDRTASTTDSTASTTDRTASTTDSTVSTTDRTASTTDSTASTTDRTASTTDRTASTTDSTASTTDRTASTTDRTASTTDRTASTTDSTASTTDRTASTTDSTVSTTDRTASTTDSTASTTDRTASTTDRTASTTDSTASTTDSTASTTDRTASTTDSTVSPDGAVLPQGKISRDDLAHLPIAQEEPEENKSKPREESVQPFQHSSSPAVRDQPVVGKVKSSFLIKIIEDIFKEISRIKSHVRDSLTPESFKYYKILGEGHFGRVLLASHPSTDQLLAIKIATKPVWLILAERQVMEATEGSRFFPQLFATFQTEDLLFYVMEYVNDWTLKQFMDKRKPLDEDTIRFIAAELLCALRVLHSRDIAHCDLHTNNILLDSSGHVKVIDFGTAKIFKHSPCETESPQDFHDRRNALHKDFLLFYNVASDMSDLRDAQTYNKDDDALLDLVKKCEFSFVQLQNHRFFAGINWDEMEAGNISPPYVMEPSAEINRSRQIDVKDSMRDLLRKNPFRRVSSSEIYGFDFLSERWRDMQQH